MASLAVLGILLIACIFQCACQECNRIEYTEDKCRSADKIRIEGVEERISKGSEDIRLRLSSTQTDLVWWCGSSKERTGWGWQGTANSVRVSYFNDGTIQWLIYLCDGDPFLWPEENGQKCAHVAFYVYCPSKICLWGTCWGEDNCIYRVETTESAGGTTTTTTSLAATGSAERNGVEGSFSAEWSETNSETWHKDINDYTYLVIPAGRAYCKYVEAVSEYYYSAPLKYRYRCGQTAISHYSETCQSNLDHCPVGSCEPNN